MEYFGVPSTVAPLVLPLAPKRNSNGIVPNALMYDLTFNEPLKATFPEPLKSTVDSRTPVLALPSVADSTAVLIVDPAGIAPSVMLIDRCPTVGGFGVI